MSIEFESDDPVVVDLVHRFHAATEYLATKQDALEKPLSRGQVYEAVIGYFLAVSSASADDALHPLEISNDVDTAALTLLAASTEYGGILLSDPELPASLTADMQKYYRNRLTTVVGQCTHAAFTKEVA